MALPVWLAPAFLSVSAKASVSTASRFESHFIHEFLRCNLRLNGELTWRLIFSEKYFY
jgi:hypothetical protein